MANPHDNVQRSMLVSDGRMAGKRRCLTAEVSEVCIQSPEYTYLCVVITPEGPNRRESVSAKAFVSHRAAEPPRLGSEVVLCVFVPSCEKTVVSEKSRGRVSAVRCR